MSPEVPSRAESSNGSDIKMVPQYENEAAHLESIVDPKERNVPLFDPMRDLEARAECATDCKGLTYLMVKAFRQYQDGANIYDQDNNALSAAMLTSARLIRAMQLVPKIAVDDKIQISRSGWLTFLPKNEGQKSYFINLKAASEAPSPAQEAAPSPPQIRSYPAGVRADEIGGLSSKARADLEALRSQQTGGRELVHAATQDRLTGLQDSLPANAAQVLLRLRKELPSWSISEGRLGVGNILWHRLTAPNGTPYALQVKMNADGITPEQYQLLAYKNDSSDALDRDPRVGWTPDLNSVLNEIQRF